MALWWIIFFTTEAQRVQWLYMLLIFEASNAEAVCTIVVVGVSCCAVEVQVTSISATYRAIPIVAVSALIVEQTIDAITVASRRIKHKLTHSYRIDCSFTTL